MNGGPATSATASDVPTTIPKRFQSYRGTWAWLIQRISAVCLFLLIPLKIYTGWAIKDKVPDVLGVSHSSPVIDILLLLFFLLHGFYGLRVILIDFGAIRADRFFWRTLSLASLIFAFTIWFVYIHEH
jgi:succinate dehydrogenase hydrophobic anchor subunit